MANNRVKSVPITVTLDEETIAKLRKQANKNDRSLSAYIRWLIKNAEQDQRILITEAGREALQKGDH